MWIVFLVIALIFMILYMERAGLVADFKKDFKDVEASVQKLDLSVKAEAAAAVKKIKNYL